MADQKIKIMDLTTWTVVDTDWIPYIDISDTTQSAEWTTKRALKTDLKWDTWASITSWAFVWDDLVFTKDDTNTVTITDAKIDLKWATWDNATVDVWTTTTWAPWSSASVTNSWTTQDAIFNFTIPEWDKWDAWDNAPEVEYEFSIDWATLWHTTFVSWDLYQRISTDWGTTWSSAIKFVWEDWTWSWDMLLNTIQTVTAEKIFDKDKISTKWTSTWKTVISTANTGATDYTQTLQARNGTVANLDNVTYIWTTSIALNRTTWVQSLTWVNIDWTAGNLSWTPALPNWTTATTQDAVDNSTKIATTAYVEAKVSDAAYDATWWNWVNAIAPSKNAVRDKIEVLVPQWSITTSWLTQNTARLLWRSTASAGAVEEITVGTWLSLSAWTLTSTATWWWAYWKITNPVDANAKNIFYNRPWYSLTTASLTANRLYYIPFIPPIDITLASFWIYTAWWQTDKKVRVWIYSESSDRPSSRLTQSWDLILTTSWFKSENNTTALTAWTKYFIAFMSDVTTTFNVIRYQYSQNILWFIPSSWAWVTYYYETISSWWTELPSSSWTLTNVTNTDIPAVFYM